MKRLLCLLWLACASAVQAQQLTLTWTASPTDGTNTPATYRVERKLTGAQSFVEISAVDGGTLTYLDNAGLTYNQAATYRVRAQNAAGYSGYSNEATGTPTATPPDQVTGLTVTIVWQDPNLMASYPFTEGLGATTADASGNNNTGALSSGVTWGAGHSGAGLTFNGSGYVTVATSTTLAVTSQGTLAAWVKLGAINSWRCVLAKGNVNSDPAHNYFLELRNDNKILAGVGNGTAVSSLLSPSTLTDLTSWRHLAFTWSGQTLALYLDGVLIATTAQTVQAAANSAPLWLGQFGGATDRFVGTLDDVRVYNRALTAQEIQGLFNGQ